MKKISFLTALLSCLVLTSCFQTSSGPLSDGSYGKWSKSDGVSVQDGSTLTLDGEGAKAVLKNGKYKHFTLSMQVRTIDAGKGEVWFHTDKNLSKGYRVAINNNLEDPVWWKMTGSLVSVRNLTKNFVKDGDWFDMKIVVSGQAIAVTIDDELVVEYIQPAAPHRTGENLNALLSEGTFALASTGDGKVEFKNIEVAAYDPQMMTMHVPAQLAAAVDEQADPIIKLHQADFPVLDYHVHLKGGLTKEAAAEQSRRTGINYAIAPNCGIGFSLQSDADVRGYLDTMRSQPFILAMQAEGREWVKTFSPEVRDMFDFVFTDALTFTDDKGHRTRLWIPEETWIGGDQQKYMDMIVNRISGVLKEPADVYVNPCLLPYPMDQKFDEFWTEERMDIFVRDLVASGKALEINELYQIPNKAILMKAKEAGVKFTFGTNNVIPEVSGLEYSLRMKEECGLTPEDMYKPKRKN